MEILDCPNCDAELEVPDGVAVFDCPDCGIELSFEDDEQQAAPPARGGKSKKFSTQKKKAPAKGPARGQRPSRPAVVSRKQFLDQMRANSAYQSLRTLVSIYFWVAVVLSGLIIVGGGLLAAFGAKEQESSSGVMIFGGSMLIYAVVVLVLHAAYQFYQAYVDIADASVEQAFQAQE